MKPCAAIISGESNSTATVYAAGEWSAQTRIGYIRAKTNAGLRVLLSQVGLNQKSKNNPWYFESA